MSDSGEAFALENAIEQLKAEGFEVFKEPSGTALPVFLRGLRPDAIAIRGDEKLVVEVVRASPSAKKKLDNLSEVVSENSGWKLRAIWISTTPEPALDRLSRKDIESSIKSVSKLIEGGNLQPALLMAWATFEALGRAIAPDKFSRPQTPVRLVEVLATSGQLTHTEAEHLRRLAQARNRVIHGGLHQPVSKEDISKFIEILEMLSGLQTA